MSSKKMVLLGLLTATVLTSSLVYAERRHNGDYNDAASLAKAKISLSQAVSAAERHAHGKAVAAELEDDNGALVYGVEVIGDNKTMDVKVDIRDGKVVSSQAHREHGDEQEDDS